MNRRRFDNEILHHRDSLFRLGRSILQSEDEAADALQDLLLQLWEKRSNLSEIENVRAFVHRSMRNKCLDLIRKRERMEINLPEREDSSTDPYRAFDQKEAVNVVLSLIESLPELQRTIIRMRDVEGMEVAEVAYITGISENAVHVNLSRARQKIRALIRKEDV